jgi:hypothetical protein
MATARDATWSPWQMSRSLRLTGVAAAQLAVDSEVENGQLANGFPFGSPP